MKIGIDIGGSHIGMALVDNKGKIVEKIEEDIISDKKEIKNFLKEYISKNLNYFIKKEKQIDLIGIAAPGKSNGNRIQNLVNLGIKEMDFSVILDKYNIPYQIKNDSKAAAIAEERYGALQNYKDSVFLCIGTGIGSGVFLNKKLLKANINPGFELGHMVIEKNGLNCKCGKKGCFETYCSIKRFKDNIKNILEKQNLDSKQLLKILEEVCLSQREKNAIKIVENDELVKIENGKVIITKEKIIKVREVVEQYINDLLIGLSNVIDIFEPEAICFGGSFVYFKNIFYERLVNEMKNKRYSFNKDNIPEIILAELGNDAGMIGATEIDA